MIERAEAAAIAAADIIAHQLGSGCRAVYRLAELPFRAPVLYSGPDLSACWIAYAEKELRGLASSNVVLIDVETGEILYRGSANDEG